MTFTDPTGLARSTVGVPIPLAGNDWAVLVSVPETTAYGPNRSLIDRGLIALALAVLAAVVLASIVGSWLTRPFRRLSTQAEALSSGGHVAILESEGPTDVTELSRSIREMADRLNSQVRDTETAREEIARQAERLRDLLRRTVRLQEDERRRIASDIHDAVSPLITGALYQAQAVRMSKSNGNGNGDDHEADPQEAEGLQEVSELLERAMRELHDVIFDLRPPDLDDIGIVAALQRHVDQVNRSGLLCTLDVVGEERRLSPEVRLAVYRIAQEALHNAIRHARADESVVRIEWLQDRMRVTIQDDGSGFDVEKDGRRTGLGLMSMRERAASIGATLEIISREGSGTAIVVERLSDDLDLISDPGSGEDDFDGSMLNEATPSDDTVDHQELTNP
jgi:signal transduction histidine kinase